MIGHLPHRDRPEKLLGALAGLPAQQQKEAA